MELGDNIVILMRNRTSKWGKTSGGGVTIAFNKSKISLKEYTIKRVRSEILVASGKVQGPRTVQESGYYCCIHPITNQGKAARFIHATH